MLKHYRGNKSKYKYNSSAPNDKTLSAHKDGIYFATDKHEILMNGENYSGSTYADIEISGGPLASHITSTAGNNWPWLSADNKKIIPAGKSLQEILTTLLLKEYWANDINFSQGYLTVAVNGKPTITLDKSGDVEVGTTVTVKVTPNNNTKITEYNSTLSGFTGNQGKGYSTTINGSITNSNTVSVGLLSGSVLILQDVKEGDTVKTDNSNKRIASLSVSTNVGDLTPSSPTTGWNSGKLTTSKTVAQNVEISSNLIPHGLDTVTFSFEAKAGSNTVDATETGVCAQGRTQKITQDYYLVSSLGNRDEEHKYVTDHDVIYNQDGSTQSEGTLKTVTTNPTKAATQASVTGKYYTFYKTFASGVAVTAPESSAKPNGYTTNFTAPTKFDLNIASANSFSKIVIYTRKTIKEVKYVTPVMGQDWTTSNTNKTTAQVIKLPDGSDQSDYNKYVIATADDSNFPVGAGSYVSITYN